MTRFPHPSHGSKTSRGGFTLIELLVVMSVIAILMTLTAAGVMAWINGQMRNNTDAEIHAIYSVLMQHWGAVRDEAVKEQLWSSDVSNLLVLADQDKERARIMQIKIRLMEAFPVNFNEIPASGNCYVTAPYNLIPTGKRRYRSAYQALIYDPNPRWKTAALPAQGGTGKESVESAVCLFLALDKATQGASPSGDQLKAYLKDTDGTGNPVLADAWGTPLRFYRFAVNNTDLQKIAPPAQTVPGAFDPLDVNGKLMNWNGGNSPTYDSTIHTRTTTGSTGATVAQYAIPVIVSAGPDAKFGLTANDPRTTTLPGSAPWQSMAVGSDTNSVQYEKDNLYSFIKKAS